MPAKPPVPGKDVPLSPLHGIQQSKIDYFALGETVRKLRNSGLSLVEITDELNTKYVTDPSYKISTMSVCRWVDKNMSEEIDLRYSEETAINVYREYSNDLKTITEQIDNIKIYIDHFNKEIKGGTDITSVASKIKDMQGSLEKLLSKKHVMLQSIFAMQEKVYSYTACVDIVNRVMQMVKERDKEMFADISLEIKSDAMLAEAFKKIQPDKKGDK